MGNIPSFVLAYVAQGAGLGIVGGVTVGGLIALRRHKQELVAGVRSDEFDAGSRIGSLPSIARPVVRMRRSLTAGGGRSNVAQSKVDAMRIQAMVECMLRLSEKHDVETHSITAGDGFLAKRVVYSIKRLTDQYALTSDPEWQTKVIAEIEIIADHVSKTARINVHSGSAQPNSVSSRRNDEDN